MKANDKAAPRRRWFFSPNRAAEKFYVFHFALSLGLAAILLFFLGPGAAALRRNFEGLKPGSIADRDITAGKDVFFEDAEATRLRIDAEERLVLPVFRLDNGVTERVLVQYRSFSTRFKEIMAQDIALETGVLMVQSQFPGALSQEALTALARSSLKAQALVYAEDVLGSLFGKGFFSLPSSGLNRYNQDYFEVHRLSGDKIEVEQRARSSMITRENLPAAIRTETAGKHLASPLSDIVAGLVTSFIVENAFFDEIASAARLRRVSSQVEPVMRVVGGSEVLIRKGEMVSEESYARIQAVRSALSRADMGLSLRSLGLLLAAAVLGFFLLSRQNEGIHLGGGRGAVICVYSALLFFGLVLMASRAGTGGAPFGGIALIPVALFAGIGATMGGLNFAFSFTVVLALLSAAAANLNAYYIVFVILAGFFAAFVTAAAKTRLDLVLAALFQALAQFFLGMILLAQQGILPGSFFRLSGILALNGLSSGALMLAILPVLERSFNIPTRFRLLELSDVNAPALKELLTHAPGTYAHSMNVAHLAEAAAEEIGANPLLARVGAYYHDIGKIEQAEYFVENQHGENKHDEINPRLSATVIRSHVKIGMERARELGLPKAVVDIVAQHHGNSLISWFYDKAKKADSSINREDFVYPGVPPANKEAGVVMLADAVEASSRTLKKPSLPRLDAHVRQLIFEKVRDGQLDNCSLTLRDLELIRNAFVRILAGQSHSRIEYPKQKEQAP